MQLILLTEKELCAYLKVDRSFLYVCRSYGLPYIRLGKKIIRYDLHSVLDWFDENSSKVVKYCEEKIV